MLHPDQAGVLVSTEDIHTVVGVLVTVTLRITMVITIRFIIPTTHPIIIMGTTDPIHTITIRTGMVITMDTTVIIIIPIPITEDQHIIREMYIMEQEIQDHRIPIVPMEPDSPIPVRGV